MGTKTTHTLKQQIDAVKEANITESPSGGTSTGNSGGAEVKPADPNRPENTKNTATKLGIGTMATINKDEFTVQDKSGREITTLRSVKWVKDSETQWHYDLDAAYKERFAWVLLDNSRITENQRNAAYAAGISGGYDSKIIASSQPTTDIPVIIEWRGRESKA